MKFASIILTHYSKYDDFGGHRAKKRHSKITRKETLRMTLESFQWATKYPHELIVIDNGGDDDDTDYLVQKVRDGVITTLIRNRDNLHFAYARNQGLQLATGDYICISDNDIEFAKGWLTKCVEMLEKYDKKLIASPIITPDKDNEKYSRGTLDGNRLNAMAGSNCFVLKRESMKEIGFFRHHEIGGTYWHQKMRKMGYTVILPPENMAIHLGFAGGYNIYTPIKVEKTLSDGSKINTKEKIWSMFQ